MATLGTSGVSHPPEEAKTQAKESEVAAPKPSRADQDPKRASGILLDERILAGVTTNQ
ncbi:unnamed protein product [Arabidopsis thaliana]|uniref:Uncharacterized protein n=1 Tax=Arabidopsis thaliana TaxID=3702 RepID=A0A5S9XFV6_ARATH|nr:unnamed protein product [Arabidopsis thaliana]